MEQPAELFVARGLRAVSLTDLVTPLSGEAIEALRKLQITRLGHLSGLRISSFKEVSPQANSIFIQLALLLKRVRSERLAAQARAYAHLMNATSLADEIVWLPPLVRTIPIQNLRISDRLFRVFNRAEMKVCGQLHGVSLRDISLLKHCGPKMIAEVRDIVVLLEGKITHRKPAARLPKPNGIKRLRAIRSDRYRAGLTTVLGASRD